MSSVSMLHTAMLAHSSFGTTKRCPRVSKKESFNTDKHSRDKLSAMYGSSAQRLNLGRQSPGNGFSYKLEVLRLYSDQHEYCVKYVVFHV